MRISHLFGVVCACSLIFSSHNSLAAAVSGQGTWETTLLARDLDGDLSTIEAYYDTTLDITWLADANAAVGSAYDTYAPGLGMIDWYDASAWAASLDPYGSGIAGWRLPTVTDTGAAGFNYSYSGTDFGYNVDTASGEMASMFYDTLGNLAYYDTSGNAPQPGWGLTNTGPFSNLKTTLSGYYWSSTQISTPGKAMGFYFTYGGQTDDYMVTHNNAWAVHSGDVGTAVVPIPPAIWLFCSGLLGLIGVTRPNKEA